MLNTILEEDKIELYELKNKLTEIGAGSLNILSKIIYYLIIKLNSLSEFSWTNIQEKGLKSILLDRAIRFFSLQQERKEVRKIRKKIKRSFSNFTSKRVGKKVRKKVILFPIYLIILFVDYFRRKKKDNYVNPNKFS